MKLIVEGPDGGGKSTVIERLGLTRRHLKALRAGIGGALEHPKDKGWGGDDRAPIAYIRQMITAPDHLAFDRFYLSEQIYGPMLRGQSAITLDGAMLVDEVRDQMNIPMVICLPSFETAYANVVKPGRERPGYQTPDFLREAYDRWTDMADRQDSTSALIFNYEAESLDTLIASIRHITERS